MNQAEKLHIKMRDLVTEAEDVLNEQPDELNGGRCEDAFDAICNQVQQ